MSRPLHNLRGTEALRLLVNSVYGLLALLVTRFANQIFFILLTWTIGVVEAGTFALGLMTYAVLFTQLSILGLDFLLTREVAANRNAAGRLFGSFLALRLLTSSVCYAIVLVWVVAMRPYDAHTDLVIVVCAATIITESIGRLCQAYFAAFERIGYIATINTVLGALKLLIGVLILWQGGDALTAAYVVLAASLLGMILSLVLAYRRFPKPQWSRLLESWRGYAPLIAPFAFSSMLNTVELQADTMLVSQLAPGDPRLAVATYTAAAAVFLGLTLLAQGYRTAVLPMMARLFQQQPAHVSVLYKKSVVYSLALTLPVAALIGSHADSIAQLIYSERLSSAGPVLAVIIWSLIGFSATIPAACLLITLQRQVVMMRAQLVAMGVNLAVNLWLIPLIGPLGAAWARLASTTAMFVLVVGYLHWHSYPLAVVRDGARLVGGLAVLLLVDQALRWVEIPWMVAAIVAGLAYLATITALGIVAVEDRALLARTTGYRLRRVGSIPD